MTKIAICDCISEFQDSTYGRNKRLHNCSPDGDKGRCTVCAKIKKFK